MKKILWVKFGWSDYYRGGAVDGNFGWLNSNRGKKNEGHGGEAYNFNPEDDGRYYCYVPPQGGDHAPNNADPDGWTVVCLAKHPKRPGIHVVGWYENATLYGEWHDLSKDSKKGEERLYCISSKSAFFVPPEHRNAPFSHESIRQSKFSFLTGPDVDSTENKTQVLRILEQRMKELAPFVIKNPNENKAPDPSINSIDPVRSFGTPEHRKKVEKAAEDAVIRKYEDKGYTTTRKTAEACGYDFLFTKGKKVAHVEVKGTSSPTPQFYLTRNEFKIGLELNEKWVLAMVTSALSDSPDVKIYTRDEIKKIFDLEPTVYTARLK